jgi:hypothetical protein
LKYKNKSSDQGSYLQLRSLQSLLLQLKEHLLSFCLDFLLLLTQNLIKFEIKIRNVKGHTILIFPSNKIKDKNISAKNNDKLSTA